MPESNVPRDPVELAVHDLLVPALEATNQRLEKLRESQMSLTSQLEILQQRMQSYRDTTEPPELQETVFKIHRTRKRLHAIVTTLAVVEARLVKIHAVLNHQAVAATPP